MQPICYLLMLTMLGFATYALSLRSLPVAGRLLALRPVGTRLFASSVRPSLDDVERISRGQAAKKRGTGSRAVPHRLNEMERKEWEVAKKRRYLALRGTGWRKERGDSPLANIYRQLCDALAIPSISLQRGVLSAAPSPQPAAAPADAAVAPVESPPSPPTASPTPTSTPTSTLLDIVTVDLSPLRLLDCASIAQAVALLAAPADFPSLVQVSDTSNITSNTGGLYSAEELEGMLKEDVIWRVPAFGVAVSFAERRDAKRFAESVAKKWAGGGDVGVGGGDDDEE